MSDATELPQLPPPPKAATAVRPVEVVYAPAARERRRWPVGVLAGLAALAVVVAGSSALVSWRNGSAWERRAAQQETRAVTAEGRARELHKQLNTSEAQVAALQRRTNSLANEKAQAEDEREILRVYAKQYRNLTVRADSVSSELTSCIGQLAGILGDPYASYGVFSTALDGCERALADYRALQALIDSIPPPPGTA